MHRRLSVTTARAFVPGPDVCCASSDFGHWPISASTGSAGEAKDGSACSAAFAGLIKFLGDAKLRTPGTDCRSWPVAPVSQNSFARKMRIVLPDTARWDGSHLRALARGSDRCAPTLPSSAHEEGRPSVLVELRAPEVDEKNCETNPITSQESWRFRDGARTGQATRSANGLKLPPLVSVESSPGCGRRPCRSPA
jgi:hypothetical protein